MAEETNHCTTSLWIAGQFQKWAIGIAELVQPRGIFRLPGSLRPNQKWVALTIDDAPSSRTDEILALLKRHSVRSTFFVHTDQISSPDRELAMQQIAEDGHELAHHMPSNVAYGRRMSAEQFRADFDKSHQRLVQYGEAFRPWFRPPMGIYHRGRMQPVLQEYGYDQPLKILRRDHFMASFAPWDSTGSTNTADAAHNRRMAERYADQLTASLYPGSIVVFHDGEEENNHARLASTLVSLDRFLERTTKSGWKVCSIGQITQPHD